MDITAIISFGSSLWLSAIHAQLLCCMSWIFFIAFRQLRDESLVNTSFQWNPQYMDPRNVTLRSAAVQTTNEEPEEQTGLDSPSAYVKHAQLVGARSPICWAFWEVCLTHDQETCQ